MKVLTAVLLLAILVLAVQLYKQRSVITEQQSRLDALAAQVASHRASSISPSLEYQSKCAEQAKKAFRDMGYKSNDRDDYENHYDARTNKCFILVKNLDLSKSPTIWVHRNLFDAYERKQYAEYHWHTVTNKKYWEVPPFMCKVLLPSGEEHVCSSDDEFEQLIKNYMEN